MEFNPMFFSAIARSFLKGLLMKNPVMRLGSGGSRGEVGAKEIKEHPWFDSIDFGALEAGFLDPPLVPNVCSLRYFPHKTTFFFFFFRGLF